MTVVGRVSRPFALRRELTGDADLVEFGVVLRILPTFCFVLFSSTVWLSPRASVADMLVRYPAGMESDDAAALVDSLKSIVGPSVLGAAAGVPSGMRQDVSVPDAETAFERRIEAARSAYKRLDLPAVLDELSGLDAACLAEASFAGCRMLLFETELLRGMTLLALERDRDAAHAFRSAHAMVPEKVPDPKAYSPNILRAFAGACTEAESMPSVSVRFVVEPFGAPIFVDGRSVDGPVVALTPGRHIAEAQLPGFERTFAMVDVSDTAAPKPVTLRLVPLENPDAWAALIAAVSDPTWRPASPGSEMLMRRFRIESVLLLAYSADGKFLLSTLGRIGDPYRTALPPLDTSATSLPAAFEDALRAALGLPFEPPASTDGDGDVRKADGPTAETQTGPILAPASDAEEIDAEEDAEEEDASIQFTESGDARAEAEASDRKRILRSPWLWISVGIVAAVVTGVVLSIQLHD